MRIIGGKYRGKKLFSPENPGVRPTSDRAREALFNILRSRLGSFSGCRLLDVFCGSGAFALEALSQGFEGVAAVDADVRPLLKNAALFPAEKNKLQVINSDARKLRSLDVCFDVMFMDAPYNQGLSVPVLETVAANGLLKPGAWCLIEVHKDEECPLPPAYETVEERRYGLAKIIIARYCASLPKPVTACSAWRLPKPAGA